MRGFQQLPEGDGPKRRIVAMLERGRWVVYRGWHRPKPAGPPEFCGEPSPDVPGGLVQVRIDTSRYGTDDDSMLRLMDVLVQRWPDHVVEVLRDEEEPL